MGGGKQTEEGFPIHLAHEELIDAGPGPRRVCIGNQD
jgi:hypothetical protein